MAHAPATLPRTEPLASPSAPCAGDHAPGSVGLGRLDDDTLMAAVAAGNAAALDQLYVRYRPVAFAAAYAIVQDRFVAEDVVHDAWLRVWGAARSFRPERGAPRPWLLTIVRNTAIDTHRVRQAARRHHDALVRHATGSLPAEDFATTVAITDDARQLRDALAALPPAQRQAVELAFLDELTHGEIAARTGVPLGTIKGRIRLGLRRLRRGLVRPPAAPSAPRVRGRFSSN